MDTTSVIDLQWMGHSGAIASALLRSQDSAILIDPGPASTVATLRQRLESLGVPISSLSAILLTHIHLDHAGATGTLVRENPHLHVYVHERGAPHMIDPSKLLNSATRLYGDAMDRLYGEFVPVPADNLQVLRGGETLTLAGRNLQVLYTPGHASHHVTYFDMQDATAFVGDSAGICINGHPFILPATPPPDISLELWDSSLDAIVKLNARQLFLTHFSFSPRPSEHLEHYRERLHHWTDRAAAILASGLDEADCIQKFSDEVAAEAATYLAPDELSHYSFAGALNLSWMGLARYHRKRATSTTAAG